ncbi:uncharacterized protein EAF02_010963 [Botrytis sinoallii]|uniref:uncharacterized protein n=1 Tax=Botrytis sinoallii TaxID=1463999 RepID=UPI0019013769|nr:uncharacterized protein EAF02_010963 [Botrytis sinoallii]KAF7859515.1 hypothetical protein EAF02_010963 [Botrytis sinoallii]
MFSKSIIAASLLTAVTAHQNFHQFWVNGVSPGYQVSIRMPPSNSPVLDVASDNITCNVNGNVVPSGVNTTAANEGDAITVQWDPSTHPGPIQHYLFGPVDDASMATGIGSWFKIDEYVEVNGTWASNLMDAGNMSYTFKLPTGMASGEYLLRSEMLALHSAQTVGGAQWYIGCAQLSITGTGGDSCGPSIELPGDYNATDPSIYIPDIYYGFDISTYTPPGGAIATCAASGAGATGAASATAVATSAVSSAAPSSSAAALSSSAVVAPSSVASSVEGSSSAVLPSSSVAAIVTSVPSTLVTATSTPAATSSAVEVGDDECDA